MTEPIGPKFVPGKGFRWLKLKVCLKNCQHFFNSQNQPILKDKFSKSTNFKG